MTQKFIISAFLYLILFHCYSQSIELDTTYGYYGKATCLKKYQGYSATIQSLPNEKTLVVTLDTKHSRLICLNNDGTLDKTFGGNGIVSIDLKRSYKRDETCKITSAIVAPDGKIFVGGFDGDSIVLFSFNHKGVPDSSFGVNGVVTIPSKVNTRLPELHLSLFFGNKILISDNGFLPDTMLGNNTSNFSGVVTMRLVDSKGFVDTAFGNDGKIAMTDPVSSFSVRVETDTTILLSATTVGKRKEIWMNRYSYLGVSIEQYHFFNDERYDPVLMPNKKFLIFGDYRWQQYYLKQYFIDGTLDTTFGDKGVSWFSREDNTGLYPSSHLIRIIDEDKILLATTPLVFSDYEICLMMFDKKGQVFSKFGNNGRVLTSLSKGEGYGDDKNSLTPKILGWLESPRGEIIIVAKQLNSTENTSDLITLRYILE